MKAKKILVPTDFSENSQFALRYAASLAKDMGAELLLVFVNDPVGFVETGFSGYPVANQGPEFERMLGEIELPDSSIPTRRIMLEGDPASEIIREAKDEDVDMIVIATHGHTGLQRLLLGSVAEVVVRKSPCPVLTVKQPQTVDSAK